jgi:hypothetical protein
MRNHCRLSRGSERGAALILAIIAIAVLSILGIALMLSTTTELQISGNESYVNKAFYAADSGIEWAAANLKGNASFVGPTGGGTLTVPINSPHMNDITVTVPPPVFVGQAPVAGSTYGQWFEKFYSVSSNAALTNPNNSQDVANKLILAEIGVQPLQGSLGP